MGEIEDLKVNVAKKRLNFVSKVFVLVGLVLLLVSLATPYWRGDAEYNEGVFQRCTKHKCGDLIMFEGTDPEIDSVRIVSLIAIGYIAISLLLGVFGIANQDVITFLRMLSFLHVVIAFSIYTVFHPTMEKLWGYYLGWSGVAIYGMGFIMGAISAHCMKDPNQDGKK